MNEHLNEGGKDPKKESFCPCTDFSGQYEGPDQPMPEEEVYDGDERRVDRVIGKIRQQ